MKRFIRKIFVKWLCLIGRAVDISSGGGYPGDMLSNFTPYKFTFRGREFCSMESLLQGLKFEGAEKQDKIFKLVGKDAKRKGEEAQVVLGSDSLLARNTNEKRLCRIQGNSGRGFRSIV